MRKFDEIFDKIANFSLKYEGYVSTEDLTIGEIIDVYYNDYWKGYKCDLICEISPKIAMIVFDTQISSDNGIRLLQSTIKSFNESPFNKITISNVYDDNTHKLLKDLNIIAPNYVTYNLLLNRIPYYNMITRKNPNLKRYLNHWINRVISLRNLILEV